MSDDDCATSARARLATAAAPSAPIIRTLSLANKVAHVLRRQGRYDQARRLVDDPLRRCREVLGADHRAVAPPAGAAAEAAAGAESSACRATPADGGSVGGVQRHRSGP